jgi:hypothetical protein
VTRAKDSPGADNFTGLGLDGQEVNRQNFPLPIMQERLHAYALDLHRGKGFFSVRGLDPNDYSPEDNVIIFLGISSYIAERRGKQDTQGNMFGKWATAIQETLFNLRFFQPIYGMPPT